MFELEEICDKIKCFPYSDNSIDYVREKLKTLPHPGKYVRKLNELLDFGMSGGDINEWDRRYDELCRIIMNKKPIIWTCRYCGRKFNDILLHNCKGTVRKRGLSFINRETGLDTLMNPGEIYLYENKLPVKVKVSRREDIIGDDGNVYMKKDMYPIRIKMKTLGDVSCYKFGNYEFYFIKDSFLVYEGDILVKRGTTKFKPNFFHQIQRLYPEVIKWHES